LVFTVLLVFSEDHSVVGEELRPAAEFRRSTMMQVGEELEYKVTYSFFNLGTIRFRITDRYKKNGRPVYRAVAWIDSNPSLPFVDLHIRFVSEIDEEMYSHSWVADDSTKDEIVSRVFSFDYENMRVLVENGRKKAGGNRVVERVDTFAISDRIQDGLSLFFYAREHVRQKKDVVVPTFIDKKQVNTNINFMNKITEEEVDAVEYPIEVVHFDGRMDYEGVFGLTGYFQGWFSNDEARIPIVARMKVLLGSVKIQLQKWNRSGWQPPRYQGKE
jgi:hypothetical protein